MDKRYLMEAVFGEASTSQVMSAIPEQQLEELVTGILSAPIDALLDAVGAVMAEHVAFVLSTAGQRPSVMAGVPMLYEQLVARVVAALQSDNTARDAMTSVLAMKG